MCILPVHLVATMHLKIIMFCQFIYSISIKFSPFFKLIRRYTEQLYCFNKCICEIFIELFCDLLFFSQTFFREGNMKIIHHYILTVSYYMEDNEECKVTQSVQDKERQ